MYVPTTGLTPRAEMPTGPQWFRVEGSREGVGRCAYEERESLQAARMHLAELQAGPDGEKYDTWQVLMIEPWSRTFVVPDDAVDIDQI